MSSYFRQWYCHHSNLGRFGCYPHEGVDKSRTLARKLRIMTRKVTIVRCNLRRPLVEKFDMAFGVYQTFLLSTYIHLRNVVGVGTQGGLINLSAPD